LLEEIFVGLIGYLEEEYSKVAKQDIAIKQQAYLRNQFQFLGLIKPLQQKILKFALQKFPYVSEKNLIQLLQDLWKKEHREFQYAALCLARRNSKFQSDAMFGTYEMMIRNKSWWDTVDEIAPHLVGSLVCKNPRHLSLMDKWIQDPHMWIRRSALLFQLRFKRDTNEKKLFDYCEEVMHEKEFFIRKAIGWALREYSKTNPASVKTFIKLNHSLLSPLSIREGSKYTGVIVLS
jgi:3-methyladenine DNA glycosylase AlkD